MNPAAKTLEAVRVEGTGLPFPFNATQSWNLPEDQDQAVDLTAAAMCAMIHHAASTSVLVEQVSWDFRESGHYSRGGALNDVWQWLKQHHRFQADPLGQELLRHPDQLITEYNGGMSGSRVWHADCDDLAMLAGAIIVRMGLQCKIVVIGREAEGPFEHVYIEVNGERSPYIAPHWLVIDPQETSKPFEEREHARRRQYPVFL